MDEIRKIVNNGGLLSDGQIIQIFHWIGEQGDIILLKNDGPRELNKFTVVIISPTDSSRNSRLDGMELKVILSRVLKEYFDKLDCR